MGIIGYTSRGLNRCSDSSIALRRVNNRSLFDCLGLAANPHVRKADPTGRILLLAKYALRRQTPGRDQYVRGGFR